MWVSRTGSLYTKAPKRRFISTMSTFKFAGIQVAVTADKEHNLNNARALIKEAVQNGAKVVALPVSIYKVPTDITRNASIVPMETSISLPMLRRYQLVQPSKCFKMLLKNTKSIWWEVSCVNFMFNFAQGSFPEKVGDSLYNTSLTFGPDGKLLGQHRKVGKFLYRVNMQVHLFDIDVPGKIRFVESETLSPGSSLTVIETGNTYRSSLLTRLEYCPIGVGICYDMRFAELAQLYQKKGCKFLIYPGAFNMTTGPAHWELLQRVR